MKPRILATIFLCCLPAHIENAQSTADKLYPAVKREGVITGRVVGDDGQPVAGANIIAARLGAISSSLQIITSDDDGNFKLAGLVPGAYTLDVELAGYIVARNPSALDLYRIGESMVLNLIKGGVITGRVTDLQGDPIVGVSVFAQRVRDPEGHPAIPNGGDDRKARLTDDRGVYRLYGLNPGIYLVSAITGSTYSISPASTPRHAPTYYPSTTRDTASEITVHSGEEVSGIDISHRNERGHIISGTVSGEVETKQLHSSVQVKLLNVKTGQPEESVNVSEHRGFAFYGIRDGEYEIAGLRVEEGDNGASSAPRRIVVSGADVTGIRLRLVNLGSITGRVVIHPASSSTLESRCETGTQFSVEEIFVNVRRDGMAYQNRLLASLDFDRYWRGDTPKQNGEFVLKDLEPGQYHVEANLPDEKWYIRAIHQSATGTAKKKIDASHSGIAVKTGEKISGIEVVIAEGAATLRGNVAPSNEEQATTGLQGQSRFRVHMIPAESSSADNILRYYEMITSKDGSFDFKHIAPGKYLMIARPVSENESIEIQPRRPAWDAIERSKLRREAERSRHEIELQPCQRVKDYVFALIEDEERSRNKRK
jgi:Carboxypeptidase regulatory-like domain